MKIKYDIFFSTLLQIPDSITAITHLADVQVDNLRLDAITEKGKYRDEKLYVGDFNFTLPDGNIIATDKAKFPAAIEKHVESMALKGHTAFAFAIFITPSKKSPTGYGYAVGIPD